MDDLETLVDAAKRGDLPRVLEVIRSNPAVADARLPNGESPLMAALYRGHGEVVDAIADAVPELDVFVAAALGRTHDLEKRLQEPDAVRQYAYDGWTPLHLAAFFGRLEAVRRLLDAAADCNAISKNSMSNTPLHAATAGGHAEVAVLMIQRGADVHVRDSGGYTPLHIAAENGLVTVVEALLARGADPYAIDRENKTPLARAAAKNRNEIIDLINARRSDTR